MKENEENATVILKKVGDKDKDKEKDDAVKPISYWTLFRYTTAGERAAMYFAMVSLISHVDAYLNLHTT